MCLTRVAQWNVAASVDVKFETPLLACFIRAHVVEAEVVFISTCRLVLAFLFLIQVSYEDILSDCVIALPPGGALLMRHESDPHYVGGDIN